MLKRLLIFFVVHLLVITLVINTYSEASESPWDVRSMRSGQTILVLKTGNVTYGDTLMLVLENKNGKCEQIQESFTFYTTTKNNLTAEVTLPSKIISGVTLYYFLRACDMKGIEVDFEPGFNKALG